MQRLVANVLEQPALGQRLHLVLPFVIGVVAASSVSDPLADALISASACAAMPRALSVAITSSIVAALELSVDESDVVPSSSELDCTGTVGVGAAGSGVGRPQRCCCNPFQRPERVASG